MYVITGATGNTGSVIANRLLDAGKQVRVLVRSAHKAAALAARGAQVVELDLNDRAALQAALASAQGAYLLSPPDSTSSDFLRERESLLATFAAAAKAAGVAHLVFLSSIGAHRAEGTGIIRSAYNGERLLRASGVPSTFLRAGYFVENWAGVLPAAKSDGVLPSFIPAELKLPMVATADIGSLAAGALLEGPRGTRVIELGGPVDASPHDVARTVAAILGRPVTVAEAPLEAVVPAFQSFGASPNVADLYRGLYAGIHSGTVAWQTEGTEAARGATSLETTLRQLLG